MMDTLIRERNGKEEVWYSEEYLYNQIELAHQAGIAKGIRVEFHAASPIDGEEVDNLIDEFKKKVDKLFNFDYK